MTTTIRRTTLATLAALLALSWSFSPTAASATVIPGAVTSISTTATSVGQWSEVDFTCTWAVPAGSAPGDTFTLQLPAQLEWFGSADFTLRTSTGAAVATGHADSNGLVVFTLTDYVRTHTSVHGDCAFSTLYDATTDGSTVPLTFAVGSNVIRVPVTTAPPACTTDCPIAPRTTAFKWSWWTDATQAKLQSFLASPPVASDKSDVVISDSPGAGLALDCASLNVVIGTHLSAGGSLTDPTDTASYPWTKTCSATSLTVTAPGLPRGEMVDVFIQSFISDPQLAEYSNNGEVVVDAKGTPVSTTTKRSTAGGSGTGVTPTPVVAPVVSPVVSPPTSSTRPKPKSAGSAPVEFLPNTGNPATPWLATAGVLLVLAGGYLIRRASRLPDSR